MKKYYLMTYLTENAMELMEQLFELKLQSKSTLNKFKKISQNPFRTPMLILRMIVMTIVGVYNKIIIHHSCNGISCIYSCSKQYSSTNIMYLGPYVCKCSRKFNITYPQIQRHVRAYRGRRRGRGLRNVIFQEIFCTYYKDSPFLKIIFTTTI